MNCLLFYTLEDLKWSLFSDFLDLEGLTVSGRVNFGFDVSRKRYMELKESKQHSALRGFVGLAYSYGGGWWNGYTPKIGDRNYVDETWRSLVKIQPKLKKVIFKHGDYSKLDLSKMKRALIYCDPPYADRNQKYVKDETNKFDSEKFWKIMRKWSKRHVVVVSETSAPPDFVRIWKKKYDSKISSSKTSRTEKLFVHINCYKYLERNL
jgi:site-specific DNA-adenine methylase